MRTHAYGSNLTGRLPWCPKFTSSWPDPPPRTEGGSIGERGGDRSWRHPALGLFPLPAPGAKGSPMPKPQSIRAAERYLNAAGAEPRPHNHPQDMANPPSPGAGDTAGAATTVSSDAAAGSSTRFAARMTSPASWSAAKGAMSLLSTVDTGKTGGRGGPVGVRGRGGAASIHEEVGYVRGLKDRLGAGASLVADAGILACGGKKLLPPTEAAAPSPMRQREVWRRRRRLREAAATQLRLEQEEAKARDSPASGDCGIDVATEASVQSNAASVPSTEVMTNRTADFQRKEWIMSQQTRSQPLVEHEEENGATDHSHPSQADGSAEPLPPAFAASRVKMDLSKTSSTRVDPGEGGGYLAPIEDLTGTYFKLNRGSRNTGRTVKRSPTINPPSAKAQETANTASPGWTPVTAENTDRNYSKIPVAYDNPTGVISRPLRPTIAERDKNNCFEVSNSSSLKPAWSQVKLRRISRGSELREHAASHSPGESSSEEELNIQNAPVFSPGTKDSRLSPPTAVFEIFDPPHLRNKDWSGESTTMEDHCCDSEGTASPPLELNVSKDSPPLIAGAGARRKVVRDTGATSALSSSSKRDSNPKPIPVYATALSRPSSLSFVKWRSQEEALCPRRRETVGISHQKVASNLNADENKGVIKLLSVSGLRSRFETNQCVAGTPYGANDDDATDEGSTVQNILSKFEKLSTPGGLEAPNVGVRSIRSKFEKLTPRLRAPKQIRLVDGEFKDYGNERECAGRAGEQGFTRSNCVSNIRTVFEAVPNHLSPLKTMALHANVIPQITPSTFRDAESEDTAETSERKITPSIIDADLESSPDIFSSRTGLSSNGLAIHSSTPQIPFSGRDRTALKSSHILMKMSERSAIPAKSEHPITRSHRWRGMAVPEHLRQNNLQSCLPAGFALAPIRAGSRDNDDDGVTLSPKSSILSGLTTPTCIYSASKDPSNDVLVTETSKSSNIDDIVPEVMGKIEMSDDSGFGDAPFDAFFPNAEEGFSSVPFNKKLSPIEGVVSSAGRGQAGQSRPSRKPARSLDWSPTTKADDIAASREGADGDASDPAKQFDFDANFAIFEELKRPVSESNLNTNLQFSCQAFGESEMQRAPFLVSGPSRNEPFRDDSTAQIPIRSNIRESSISGHDFESTDGYIVGQAAISAANRLDQLKQARRARADSLAWITESSSSPPQTRHRSSMEGSSVASGQKSKGTLSRILRVAKLNSKSSYMRKSSHIPVHEDSLSSFPGPTRDQPNATPKRSGRRKRHPSRILAGFSSSWKEF